MPKVDFNWTDNLLHLNTPQDSNTTVMLILCLKKLSILSLSFQWMKVTVEIHKIIICTIYSTVFLTWGWYVNDVFMRMPLINQIIKDASWYALHSMSNIHRHFGNRAWVCPMCPKLFAICIHTHLTHNGYKGYETKRSKKLLYMNHYFLNR